MATIHIAVAGSGPVDRGTVTELLDDWLGIDSKGRPTNDDEVHLVIPASADHVTPAVKAIYNWSGEVEPEVPYTAIVAQTLDKASKVIRDNAASAVPTRDGEVYTVLGTTLAERFTGDRYLLVAGDEGDEDLLELVGYAHDEDITVLDLRDALKQITPPEPEVEADEDAGEDEDQVDGTDATEDEDQADEEPCEGGTQTLVPLPDQETAEEPQETLESEVAAAHHRLTAADPNGIQGVIAVLEDVTHHLRLVDESNAAANLAAPRYRPITERALRGLEWAKSLQYDGLKSVTAPAEVDEPAPAKRVTGKVRKEWLNPKTEQWEPLRGRPRKDVEIREVAA